MIPWGSGALDLPSNHSPAEGYGTPPSITTTTSTSVATPATAPIEQKQATISQVTTPVVQPTPAQPEFKRGTSCDV